MRPEDVHRGVKAMLIGIRKKLGKDVNVTIGVAARKIYEYYVIPPSKAFILAVSRNDREMMRMLLPNFLKSVTTREADRLHDMEDYLPLITRPNVPIDGLLYLLSPEMLIPITDRLADLGFSSSPRTQAQYWAGAWLATAIRTANFRAVEQILEATSLVHPILGYYRILLKAMVKNKWPVTPTIRRYILDGFQAEIIETGVDTLALRVALDEQVEVLPAGEERDKLKDFLTWF